MPDAAMVTGPFPDQAMSESDRKLQATSEAFPDWDIHRVFGGYEAVPKGTPVVRSIDLDGLAQKLHSREQS